MHEFLQHKTYYKIANYIFDHRDEERPDEIQQKLNKIDLHGAMLTVADANCKDYVGIEGIVVKETRNMFIIVTSSGTTKSEHHKIPRLISNVAFLIV